MSDTPIGRVMLRNVRLGTYPALFQKEAYLDGKPKYKAKFVVAKGSAEHKAVEDAILAVLKAKLPQAGKAEKTLAGIRTNPMKCAWQDGDMGDFEAYAGSFVLSAKSDIRPSVIDGAREPLGEDSGRPYPGCYVNASVDIFAYDNGGVGISAGLRGVQFVKDGDAFAGGSAAKIDEFDVVEASAAEDFA